VQLLRLDPRRVLLKSALANDEVLGLETVSEMARHKGATAAINAGFFLPTGEPAGLLKVDGEVVSDSSIPHGAVALASAGRDGDTSLLFDRVTVALRLSTSTSVIEVDGVDTSRGGTALAWFTPRFFAHTDTVEEGTDWVLGGSPLAVIERRDAAMRTVIPRDGAVLSLGGRAPPSRVPSLKPGDQVAAQFRYLTSLGSSPQSWAAAPHIVAGAGLLVHRGRWVTDWSPEQLRAGFATERHPRTMIGVDRNRDIWLVTIDGRNETLSLGMNFVELQGLADRIGLVEALNLDGGGSTTMVVDGAIVNHPSDKAGPRPVSDAILVFPASPSHPR
jgi:hypothetical protein